MHFWLDALKIIANMKLMINQTIRITQELETQISKLSKEIGESKQTVIRLAIRDGLEVVRNKFLTEQKGERNDNK